MFTIRDDFLRKVAIAFILTWTCTLKVVVSDTTSQIFGEEVLSHWDIYRSGPYGNNGGRRGEFFTDFKQSLDGKYVRPYHWPDTINIRAGGSIDSIQIFYGTYRGEIHGGLGGQFYKIRMYHGDRINRVTGRAGFGPGAEVEQLTFHTKNGKTHGPYGGVGGFYFDARPPNSTCFLGWISGRSYIRLDSITFHWRCPSEKPNYPTQTFPEEHGNFGNSIFIEDPKIKNDFSRDSNNNFRINSSSKHFSNFAHCLLVTFSAVLSLIRNDGL